MKVENKVRPHDLVEGSLYKVRGGNSRYLGIDVYWGETTYKFENLEMKSKGGLGEMDSMPWDVFIKPENVSSQVQHID